jgi:hypothetical protein
MFSTISRPLLPSIYSCLACTFSFTCPCSARHSCATEGLSLCMHRFPSTCPCSPGSANCLPACAAPPTIIVRAPAAEPAETCSTRVDKDVRERETARINVLSNGNGFEGTVTLGACRGSSEIGVLRRMHLRCLRCSDQRRSIEKYIKGVPPVCI